MSRVVVVGAGVVGQTYAGLLASAGHDVSLVARGHRAERLRTSGIALQRRDLTSRPTCHIVSSLDGAGPADVVLVAVRGDQLPTVQSEIAAPSHRSWLACRILPDTVRTSSGPLVPNGRSSPSPGSEA